MICPICKVECNEGNFIVSALVNGQTTRGNGGQRVWTCLEHGVMRIANVYTDAYMTAEYPNLHLVNGGWFPKTQRFD